MEAKHTPGPWTVEYDSDAMDEDYGPIVTWPCAIRPVLDYAEFTSDNQEANAHLMAAAPDLLAALTLFLDDEPCRFDHEGYCQTHSVSKPCQMQQARAAIAKATGKPAGVE